MSLLPVHVQPYLWKRMRFSQDIRRLLIIPHSRLGSSQLLRHFSVSIQLHGNIKSQATSFPINFINNLSQERHNLGDFASSLRCTDDISEEQLSSNSIPFETKAVNPDERKRMRQARLDSQPMTMAKVKKTIIEPYVQLMKPRLTILVMLSAICSYALSPNAASISQLLSLTLGTTFCSGAANAINMGREPAYDKQMSRTQARPVVRGLVTPKQAFQFSAVIGTLGVTTLYLGVNPTVAFLGFLNIPLYSWIYTSMKRTSILNTWVGAIVGAIPPLMGWAAASSLADPGAWILALLLYAWQFPHFNALSHNVKEEYKRAGYVMAAWKRPMLNARVALRYSLLMFPICIALSYFNITDWVYSFDSSIVNAWLSYWCFKFWLQQRKNYSKTVAHDSIKFKEGMQLSHVFARKVMMASVLQLPIVLLLAILHKKDRWKWLFNEDRKFK